MVRCRRYGNRRARDLRRAALARLRSPSGCPPSAPCRRPDAPDLPGLEARPHGFGRLDGSRTALTALAPPARCHLPGCDGDEI